MSGARGMRAERRREELRVETAVALRQSIGETQIDQLDLADAAGVDASIVSRMMSSKCGNTVTIVDLLMWLADDECRPVALRMMQFIATQSGLDVGLARGDAAKANPQALVHEACDVIRTATAAMVDGKIEAPEAREILREGEQFEGAWEDVKAHCHAVIAAEARGTRAVLS